MSDERIRKAAEALSIYIANSNFIHTGIGGGSISLIDVSQVEELRASLRPSREEIIDGLKKAAEVLGGEPSNINPVACRLIVNLAIEELRGEE